MNKYQAITLVELEARLAALASERYATAAGVGEAQALAEKAGDCEFLMARIQCLEAAQKNQDDEVAWIAPGASGTAPQSLQRIKAICAQFPELFNALYAVAATHQAISDEMLALAVKQFRRDTEALSKDDLISLLRSLGTGAHSAFDAVLRSRKTVDRKAAAAALPWGKE